MEYPSDHKKCRRFNDAGHAHALTFSCFRCRPFLAKDRSRQWMLDSIEKARQTHAFHLWAYVVMPEHVHLLIRPTQPEYSISAILMSLKQSVSLRAIAYVRREAPHFLTQMEDAQPSGKLTYRFWQRGGGYDRNIVEPVAAYAEIAYLHANPVRRGLCDYPKDWYWSSAKEYCQPGSGPLTIDRESLPGIIQT